MSDYFIFDDIDTRDFEGILVYFDNVDTVPKRIGEFIEIPNRNGSFFLDGGRYEDVTHIYDIIALSKEHASDLINALASKVGYFRLQDSFNTDEYYSAVLDSEIEPVITKERDKLTFKVMFTRKPQRWLTSGESAVSVDSGDELTNPTLFESGPLFEVKGYGTIDFNGFEIELINETVGDVSLADAAVYKNRDTSGAFSASYTFSTANFNTGDAITIRPTSIRHGLSTRSAAPESGYLLDFKTLSVASESGATAQTEIGVYVDGRPSGANNARIIISVPAITFYVGTASTHTATINLAGTIWNNPLQSMEHSFTAQIVYGFAYDGDGTVTITSSFSCTEQSGERYFNVNGAVIDLGETRGTSTLSMLGDPTYIDCDLGEAYMIIGSEVFSLNSYIDLGSDLPKLGPGANTVTYDNTITELKVTPRWWKV